MKYLIKTNFILCLESRRFQYLSIFLYSIFFITFTSFALQNYGTNSLNLMRNYRMGIVLNEGNIRSLFILIILILPLLSSIFYSDSIILDKKNGIYTYYKTRCGTKQYLLSKLITVFLVNLFTIFFLLSSIEILIWIAIPNIGIQNVSSRPIYQIIEIKDKLFLSDLYYLNPYLYNLFIIFTISLYSAFIGIISMSISLIFTNIKSSYLSVIVFLCFSIIEMIIPDRYRLNLYFQTVALEFKYFLQSFGFLLLISIILTMTIIWKERRI